LLITLFILCSSCKFKVGSSLSVSSNPSSLSKLFISGIISPFEGLIAEDSTYSHFLFSNAIATSCAEPVYAKLFAIKADGSIDDNTPLASQLIGADARYSFDLNALGHQQLAATVQYIVKAEGCNGDIYKRPITNNDNLQNIDAKSTVIAEVVNANGLITKTLKQADNQLIEALIKSLK